jgi:hypothetical protein
MSVPFRALALGVLGVAAIAAAGPAQAQSDREPLALFQDPVGPGVVGLRVDAAEALVGRIRQNLFELGRRLAPEGDCKPNLVVGILKDGGQFVERMRDDNAWLFAEMSRDDADALLSDPGPARAFLRVRTRTRDGMVVPRRESMTDLPEAAMWMAHSKIYTATRNDILSALVLIDKSAVSGLTVTQLADYATFRALARTLPDRVDQRQDSILALFEGGEKAAMLTEFDRVYLTSLYEGLPNLPAEARMEHIETATGRDLFVE